jgi:tetraacyldisaccharide 4'-kinase
MRNIIMKIWRGETKRGRWFLLLPLISLSKLYRLCLYIRSLLYNSGVLKIDEVPIPVLAVGNITIGGTGKTPVTERLASRLKEIGFSPGIITRGYKRARRGTFCVDKDKDEAVEVGDEAMMLARRTKIPVVVGARRSVAIVEAMNKCKVDLAILDDGYQVRNIKKNVDIVVVKGGERGKCTDLFPLGPCREPIRRLKDADVVLINNGRVNQEIEKAIVGIPTFRMAYRPMHLYNVKHNLITHYNVLKGKKVLAFSGLGDNRSFFELLKSLGADVVREVIFQDHYTYRNKDVKKLSSYNDVNLIVTTEKDAVKLSGMDIPDNLFYLSIEATIEKEQELIEVILKKIGITGITMPDSEINNRFQKHWIH